MSQPVSSIDCRVSLAQVWAQLAVDLRARAIRLMAQLALNLVVAQADSPLQEACYVVPTQHAQDPA
jgi:hypothetical protein